MPPAVIGTTPPTHHTRLTSTRAPRPHCAYARLACGRDIEHAQDDPRQRQPKVGVRGHPVILDKQKWRRDLDKQKWTAYRRRAAKPEPSASRVPSSSWPQVTGATAPVLVQTPRLLVSFQSSYPDHDVELAALAFCLVAGYAAWRSMRALQVRKAETPVLPPGEGAW